MTTTPKTRETIEHFLSALEDASQVTKPLTKWEEGFLMSVRDQFDRRGTLSDGQFNVLESIYAEKTA